MITHELLDAYASVQGEYEKLPWGHGFDEALWDELDGLLLELHLVKHGYAHPGFERHLEREMDRLCADADVAARVKGLRL